MKLIIGLGNPGKNYKKTRHNVGFMVLEALRDTLPQEDCSAWELSKKFNAEIATCTYHEKKIILAKPMTFMNDSGIAAELIAAYYKIPPHDIIVVHDDKDLVLGDVRTQANRGAAGHRGVQSVIQHLGNYDITRVRIGIRGSRETELADTAKFVLGKFGLLERSAIKKSIAQSVAKILDLLK